MYMYLQALDTLQLISDGSLDDVDFPGNSHEIKQEPEDFDLPANVDELDEKDDIHSLHGPRPCAHCTEVQMLH